MTWDWSRRRFLRAGTLWLVAGLAGCGGSSTGSPTPTDTDAGTDSYGLLVRNELDETVGATVTAGPVWEDRTVFEESVSPPPTETRSWNGVLNPIEGDDGYEELIVEAELTSGITHDDERWTKSTVHVTPGSPDAPTAADVHVTMRIQPLGPDSDVDHRIPAIAASIGPPPEATPWSYADEGA